MSTTWSHLGLLLLTAPGFVALALAMERHQHDVFGRALTERRSRGLLGLGWTLLTLALMLAIHTQGMALGLVSWAGHLSLAAWLVYLGLVVLDRHRARRRPSPKAGRQTPPPAPGIHDRPHPTPGTKPGTARELGR